MQQMTRQQFDALIHKWREKAADTRENSATQDDRYQAGLSDGLMLACDDLSRLLDETAGDPRAEGQWAWEGGHVPHQQADNG